MLKIVSDPTVAPIREVDLYDAAENLVVVPAGQLASRNREFERPDGGLNVAFRRRRAEFDLALRPLTDSQVVQLEQLAGMQGQPLHQRVPVYLFPDFDRTTRLSFPGQRSKSAWIQKSDGTLEWRAPDQTGRGSVQYVDDGLGNFSIVGVSVPAFEPGPLGYHHVRTAGYANKAAVPYPLSGGVGWSAGAGAPTLSFDADEPAHIALETGAMRVEKAGGGVCQFYPTSAPAITGASGQRHEVSVWIKGNVEVTLIVSLGAATPVTTSAVRCYPDRWTRVDGSIVSVDASTSASVLVNLVDQGRDHVCWVGGLLWIQHSDDGLHPLEPWNDGTMASENYRFDAIRNVDPAGFSFAGSGWMPRYDSRHRLFWAQNATSGDHYNLEFARTVLRATNGGAVQQVAIPALDWASYEGKPFVASIRRGLDRDYVELAVQTDTVGHSKAGIVRYSAADAGDHGLVHDAHDFVMGSFGGWNPSTNGMSWFRLDGRTWSDGEMRLRERYILERGFRQVVRACQGRKFILQSVQATPIPGTSYYDGTVRAVEIDVEDEQAVVI